MNDSKAVEILNKIEALPCGYCYQGGKEFEEAVALAVHVLNIHESLEKKIEYLTKARPKGEWVLQAYEHFQGGNELYKYDCNICGHREEHAYSDSELSNFCPNCGADMRKENNV